MSPTRRQRSVDPPTLCHYADNPRGRPHCTLTAQVRYGSVLLCRSCATLRSTLGKGQRSIVVTSPDVDVLAWIADAQRESLAAQRALAAAVFRARQAGQPWSAIAARLGVSRQAAQQRFARHTP